MPNEHTYYGEDVYAGRILANKPIEFSVEEFGWQCKLGYEGEFGKGKYLLWVSDVPATSLPKAPPI